MEGVTRHDNMYSATSLMGREVLAAIITLVEPVELESSGSIYLKKDGKVGFEIVLNGVIEASDLLTRTLLPVKTGFRETNNPTSTTRRHILRKTLLNYTFPTDPSLIKTISFPRKVKFNGL